MIEVPFTEEDVERVAEALQKAGAIPGYLRDDQAEDLARAALEAFLNVPYRWEEPVR